MILKMMLWGFSTCYRSSTPHKTYRFIQMKCVYPISWILSFSCTNPNNNDSAAPIRPCDFVVTHFDFGWWCMRRNHNPSNTQGGPPSRDQQDEKAMKPISHSSKLTTLRLYSQSTKIGYLSRTVLYSSQNQISEQNCTSSNFTVA